jgi:hypothetical protein
MAEFMAKQLEKNALKKAVSGPKKLEAVKQPNMPKWGMQKEDMSMDNRPSKCLQHRNVRWALIFYTQKKPGLKSNQSLKTFLCKQKFM